jgi:broad specificity phosphatase PhoE
MSYLILVKHAMPEIEPGVPASRWHLSAGGREASAWFARQLASYAPARVFSSAEPKAHETAQIIAGHLGLGCEPIEALGEHRRDAVPLLAGDDFAAAVRRCLENPASLVFGSETANEALARFRSAMDAVQNKIGDGDILVVAHGTVISLYVSALTGTAPFAIWQQLGLPSCVVMSREDVTKAEIIGLAETPAVHLASAGRANRT